MLYTFRDTKSGLVVRRHTLRDGPLPCDRGMINGFLSATRRSVRSRETRRAWRSFSVNRRDYCVLPSLTNERFMSRQHARHSTENDTSELVEYFGANYEPGLFRFLTPTLARIEIVPYARSNVSCQGDQPRSPSTPLAKRFAES